MLAGGNDESRGKHPDGIVHSPLTDGPPTHIPLNPLDCNTDKSVTYNRCK